MEFDETNCTIYYRPLIRLIAPPTMSAAKIEEYKHRIENSIELIWNSHDFAVVPFKCDCPCPYGWKIVIDVQFTNRTLDVNRLFLTPSLSGAADTFKVDPDATITIGPATLDSEKGSHTIAHEFGHLMGLLHPGQIGNPEAPGVPQGLYPGTHPTDTEGYEMDIEGLMGFGSNIRPQYFWRFVLAANAKYPGCGYFVIEPTAPIIPMPPIPDWQRPLEDLFRIQ